MLPTNTTNQELKLYPALNKDTVWSTVNCWTLWAATLDDRFCFCLWSTSTDLKSVKGGVLNDVKKWILLPKVWLSLRGAKHKHIWDAYKCTNTSERLGHFIVIGPFYLFLSHSVYHASSWLYDWYSEGVHCASRVGFGASCCVDVKFWIRSEGLKRAGSVKHSAADRFNRNVIIEALFLDQKRYFRKNALSKPHACTCMIMMTEELHASLCQDQAYCQNQVVGDRF